jgi:hypothetical protein
MRDDCSVGGASGLVGGREGLANERAGVGMWLTPGQLLQHASRALVARGNQCPRKRARKVCMRAAAHSRTRRESWRWLENRVEALLHRLVVPSDRAP